MVEQYSKILADTKDNRNGEMLAEELRKRNPFSKERLGAKDIVDSLKSMKMDINGGQEKMLFTCLEEKDKSYSIKELLSLLIKGQT